MQPADAWTHDEAMRTDLDRGPSPPDPGHIPTPTGDGGSSLKRTPSQKRNDVNTLNYIPSASAFSKSPENANPFSMSSPGQGPPPVAPIPENGNPLLDPSRRRSSVEQSTPPQSTTGVRPMFRLRPSPSQSPKPEPQQMKPAEDGSPEVIVKNAAFDSEVSPARPQDDHISTEDQRAAANAEQLFLPYVTREQYIPLKIARDKLKQVLAEMARIKTVHVATLDQLERQHAVLKAQMEASVAAYVKKLTSDYNKRVSILETDYKTRMQSLRETVLKEEWAKLEERSKEIDDKGLQSSEEISIRRSELDQERKIFAIKMEQDKKKLDELAKEHEAGNFNDYYQKRIEELEKELSAAKNAQSQAASLVGPGEKDFAKRYKEELRRREETEHTVQRLQRDLLRRDNDLLQAQDENQRLKTTVLQLQKQLEKDQRNSSQYNLNRRRSSRGDSFGGREWRHQQGDY